MALKDTAKGKLIYQPQGPAGEYAKWAVNLHNGCTHGCTYCYNNRGVLSHAFGTEPKYASIIVKRAKMIYESRKDTIEPDDSLDILMRIYHLDAIEDILSFDITIIGTERLQKDGGVFFSFKCDPLEESNVNATFHAVRYLTLRGIPVTILTKSTEWMKDVNWRDLLKARQNLLTIGFTLTGMDAMEVNAPSTKERIEALRKVHEMGIKTFVSLEPVIDIKKALLVIHTCQDITDEIRIGVQSPYKKDRYEPMEFLQLVRGIHRMWLKADLHFVIKESMFRQVKHLPEDIATECEGLLVEILMNS